MAKVIYFLSPFDKEKKLEVNSSDSIENILIGFNIQNQPLSISINGETPDDVDLSYIPSDEDLIEIRKPVNGNDSRSKSDLATIVQIATLVIITVLSGGSTSPWLISAIAVGGSLVAGALNKRAMELMEQGSFASAAEMSDIETASNSYSVSGATNTARPLRTLPLVMGSHRMAPDIHCEAFKSVYGEQYTIGEGQPIETSFYPGIDGANGAADPYSTWIPMPKGFLELGAGIDNTLPPYDIKIAPYHFGFRAVNPSSPNLTPGQISLALAIVKDFYNNGGNFMSFSSQFGSGEFSPLVIYHQDPADPYYNRYNLMHFVVRSFQYLRPLTFGFSWYSYIDDVFTNTPDATYNTFWYSNPPGSSKNLIRISSPPVEQFYFNVAAADNVATVFNAIFFYLLYLNGGNLNSSKTVNWMTALYRRTLAIKDFGNEGVEYSTQLMNYGIGDLEIKERLIGALDVDKNDISLAMYAPIDQDYWYVPPIIPPGTPPVYPNFSHDVLAIGGKKLVNVDSTEDPILVSDNNQYNFTYFEGQPGLDGFSFTITGQVYATNTTTGFESNSAKLEMQYKLKSEENWRIFTDALQFVNDNTKKLSYKKTLGISYPPGSPNPVENDRLQVRVRKMDLDSNNNDGSKVCNLYIDHIRFVRTELLSIVFDYNKFNAPMNIEGLFLTGLVTDSAQTNKYSALVESKCWVYDFEEEEWVWQLNRNPAFWFLFFAKGGFLNMDSDGTFVYPYSPTKGWQNYTGHASNSEIIFGCGLTFEEIDMDKILVWAEFCYDNDLNMDMVFIDDTSCAETLERIANVGRGSVTYYNGNLSVIYEDAEQVPTCLYGMANILAGTFSVDYSVADPVYKIIGKYVDRTDWESKEVSALVPFSNSDNLKSIEINLEGITETSRAQREVNLLAARQFYQRRIYSWSVDVEGLLAKRGEVVYLSHDSTQYGYSGRVKNFIISGGVVTGIQTSSILDSSISYITVRHPDGILNNYSCEVSGNNIVFTDPYPISAASAYIDVDQENVSSAYTGSIPEDFIFIAGAKETPGKLVRITEITANDDMSFTIRAVDEDPAMWAHEYESELDPESFDDSEVVFSVANIKIEYPAKGLVTLYWENINGDFIEIINEENELPVEANGAFSFTGGKVTLELTSGHKYTLVIKPFSIGTPFKAVSKRIRVWPT